MKLSEFQGFTLGCSHDLELLPVVDFTYNFRCKSCGGQERILWMFLDADTDEEALRKHAEARIRVKDGADMPESS